MSLYCSCSETDMTWYSFLCGSQVKKQKQGSGINIKETNKVDLEKHSQRCDLILYSESKKTRIVKIIN